MPHRKIILIVEDDRDILELIVAVLTSEGCSAFGVTSRDAALAWMKVNGLPEPSFSTGTCREWMSQNLCVNS